VTALRRATLNDVPRLKELGVLGWETTYHEYVSAENRARYLSSPFWSLERLRSIVANAGLLALVAEAADGEVAGFMTVEPAGDATVELTRLYVDPASRGSGIGALLFEAGVEWSREQGARWMLVNVFADNDGGRRFYERAGCVLTRLEPTAVGDQVVGDAWYELDIEGMRDRGS
jgi:ribosomal protein S18 acetylase RimI-like enzyme